MRSARAHVQVIFRNKRSMPCWGSAERKAEMLAKYRTDPDKWFQRPEELLHVAFRPYFEQYTISKTRPKRQSIEVYEDAKGFFVYLRQKRHKHLVAVRSNPDAAGTHEPITSQRLHHFEMFTA